MPRAVVPEAINAHGCTRKAPTTAGQPPELHQEPIPAGQPPEHHKIVTQERADETAHVILFDDLPETKAHHGSLTPQRAKANHPGGLKSQNHEAVLNRATVKMTTHNKKAKVKANLKPKDAALHHLVKQKPNYALFTLKLLAEMATNEISGIHLYA